MIYLVSDVNDALNDVLEVYTSLDAAAIRQIVTNKFGCVSLRHFLQILAGLDLDPKPKAPLEITQLAHGAQLPRATSLIQAILRNLEEHIDQSNVPPKKRVPCSLYDLCYSESGSLVVQLLFTVASKLSNTKLFGKFPLCLLFHLIIIPDEFLKIR